MKLLFLLKRKLNANLTPDSHIGISTGLYNSASYVNEMVSELGIEQKMVVVTDNNDIDREVSQYRPTHVIIEALWVVPEKFAVLQKLHPNVTWIIRLHSDLPFIAGEGSAMNWLGDYSACRNVVVACNSLRILQELRFYFQHRNDWDKATTHSKVIYLPNYYPTEFKHKQYRIGNEINIGCFGAIRPLKNHLLQAHAALRFARTIGVKLNFHINISRIEQKGDSAYSNLKALFQQLANKGHQLVGHEWTPREGFLEVCGQMDIGMQVTLSETFNIVAADFIAQGVPIVGSTEIVWAAPEYMVNPTDSNAVYTALMATHMNPAKNVELNQRSLVEYVGRAKDTWHQYFRRD